MVKIMKVILLGTVLFSLSAFASTEKINNTAYSVSIEENRTIELANGVALQGGGVVHATVVSENGETLSQWCRGTFASTGDSFLGGAGYCTLITQDGDFLWVWFTPTGATESKWGVISGTGRYAGATGGGTTTQISASPDGRSTITKSVGIITTN